MGDEVEEEEGGEIQIPAARFDRDAVASALIEYAADRAEVESKLMMNLAVMFASQFKKNLNDAEMFEAASIDIETITGSQDG